MSEEKNIRVSETLSRRQFNYNGLLGTVSVFKTSHVVVNGVDFKVKQFVCIQSGLGTEKNLPVFGLIKGIVLRGKNVFLLTAVCETLHFDSDLNAYCIERNDNVFQLVPSTDLAAYKPLCSWKTSVSDLEFLTLK